MGRYRCIRLFQREQLLKLVRALGEAVAGHGCDGCLFTVNAEDEEQVRVLGRGFGGGGVSWNMPL